MKTGIMRRKRGLLLVLGLLAVWAVVGNGPLWASEEKVRDKTEEFTRVNNTPEVSPETYRQLNLFSDVFERVRREYVKPVTDKKLVEAAVNGMLTDLDPHSAYMNADEFRNMQVQTRGEFGGLGIEVTMENSVVKVVSPIDDTPAAKAGLRPGDLIVAIDDQPVMGLALNDAVEKLRGRPKSQVKLGIVRDRQEPFDVTLTRDIIRIRSVRSELKGDVGYLRITQFNEQTTDNAMAALRQFTTQKGKDLKGLVLDLRNNPGGLLDQSISVANLFLPAEKEVVSTKGRNPQDNQHYFTESDALVPMELPMVVLINSGSASAAEIVSGALKDHKRAMLIGTQTFGKGSVQTVIPVPGHGAMRLTTAYYYMPSGQSIQVTGVKPNIEVRQKGEEGERSYREGDLHGALDNPNGDRAVTTHDLKKLEPANNNESMPEEKDRDRSKDESVSNDILGDETKDYQLQRALELVRGLSSYGASDEKPAQKKKAAQ